MNSLQWTNVIISASLVSQLKKTRQSQFYLFVSTAWHSTLNQTIFTTPFTSAESVVQQCDEISVKPVYYIIILFVKLPVLSVPVRVTCFQRIFSLWCVKVKYIHSEVTSINRKFLQSLYDYYSQLFRYNSSAYFSSLCTI